MMNKTDHFNIALRGLNLALFTEKLSKHGLICKHGTEQFHIAYRL